MVATHVKDVDGKDAILFTGGYKTVDKDKNQTSIAVDLLTYNIVDGKVVYSVQSYPTSTAVANAYTYLTKNLAFTRYYLEDGQNKIVSPQYFQTKKEDTKINNFPNSILHVKSAIAKTISSYTAPDTNFSIVPYITYNSNDSTRNLRWYYYVKGGTNLYCMSYNSANEVTQSANDTITITT